MSLYKTMLSLLPVYTLKKIYIHISAKGYHYLNRNINVPSFVANFVVVVVTN